MKYKQWNVASYPPEHRAALEQTGLPGILCAVLAARGISTPEEAHALLSGSGETLWPPLTMKDMDKAVARVRKALANRESIAVFGDYDVDGITATCLLTDFLRNLGGRVLPYIPDLMEEGYGLNCDAVTHLHQQGVSLILTVDCGITAVEEVKWARKLGVDVIVTDHHECKDHLPQAVAVVDPHRPDCPYPFKGLAGVGVALKLAMAISQDPEGVLEEYADLAAVGTVADVMPMTGENRIIVRRGLAELNHPRRLGLALLIREAGLSDKPITSVSVGYTLAPRINASGRMGCAHLAVELLLTQDALRGEHRARQLCELNRERQAIEGEIFQPCVQSLERAPQSGAVLLADPNWHQGVVGIVASRLSERYSCPAFMVCLSEDGMGKGSC
ncbi:MAG: single-stranded-DNA-specific exonuclease RecJ, partial [Oscillibacter sp.]|nr:single-stranded-DNA-specific exonuclease RecJ [Oscillibacter sp.]